MTRLTETQKLANLRDHILKDPDATESGKWLANYITDKCDVPLEPLHLVTQYGQPYGSVKRCCDRCGRMCWAGMDGSAKRWTDDPDVFAASGYRCDSRDDR